MRVAALLLALILAGCLRVGPGEDLHLVCEEKSASPRKAYGIEFMLAQTAIEANVTDAQRIALLEAARQHVVTPRGAPHAGFTATLTDGAFPAMEGSAQYAFHAVGVYEGEPQDEYDVWLRLDGDVASGVPPAPNPGPVQATRTLVDAALAAVNASPEASARAGPDATIAWAAWDPALPSCVRLRVGDASTEVELVANIVQGRIVDLE